MIALLLSCSGEAPPEPGPFDRPGPTPMDSDEPMDTVDTAPEVCPGQPIPLVESQGVARTEVGAPYHWGYFGILLGPGQVCSLECDSPELRLTARPMYGGPRWPLPYEVADEEPVALYVATSRDAEPGSYQCIAEVSGGPLVVPVEVTR